MRQAGQPVRPQQPAAPARRAAWRPIAVAAVIAAAATIGAAAVAGGVRWGGATTRFEVHDLEAGRAVFSRDVTVASTFRLEHTHSVTRRPVVETFSVLDRSTIGMEELWFDTFGANLPSGPEQIGGHETTFLSENGGWRVLHHGRPIGTVTVRVGSPQVDHVVTFEDGQRVRLLDLARPGAPVELLVNDR